MTELKRDARMFLGERLPRLTGTLVSATLLYLLHWGKSIGMVFATAMTKFIVMDRRRLPATDSISNLH